MAIPNMKTGKVTRPEYGKHDAQVILTATLTKGSKTRVVKFPASVKEAGMTDTQSVAADMTWLDIIGKDAIKSNLTLPTTGPNNTTITWATSNENAIKADGIVIRPANGSQPTSVTLTATINKGAVKDTKKIDCKVLSWTDIEEVTLDANELISFNSIRSNNIVPSEITTNLNLMTKGPRGTTITWTTTTPNVTSAGAVTRPSYTQGQIAFALTALVTKGQASVTRFVLELTLKALPITNQECVNKALSLIEPSLFKGTNTDFPNVIDSMTLPKTINNPECATITLSWDIMKNTNVDLANPNAKIVDNGSSLSCEITRPATTATNAQVVLRASASSSLAAGDEVSGYKSFTMTVLKA